MEYEVRTYRPGDESGIVELLGSVFGGWPRFDLDCNLSDHWRWKFRQRPSMTGPILVGVSNDSIIGCIHGIYRRIKIGRKIMLCSQGVDLAVNPDYRNTGVYKKMLELFQESLADDDVNIHYAVTSNQLLMRRAPKIGWIRFPHPIVILVRIRDVDLHLKTRGARKKLMRKYGYYLTRMANRIGNIFNGPLTSTSQFSIKKIDDFDDRIDVFWDEIKDHYSFIISRDEEDLNWRYCDQRGGKFIVKQAEGDRGVLGYIVLRINRYREDYPRGYIVDLVTFPDRPDVADALIKNAIQYFDDSEVNIVHYGVVRNHPYESLFKRNGFLYSRENLFVTYNPIQVESEVDEFQKAPANRLHFQYGDIDSI